MVVLAGLVCHYSTLKLLKGLVVLILLPDVAHYLIEVRDWEGRYVFALWIPLSARIPISLVVTGQLSRFAVPSGEDWVCDCPGTRDTARLRERDATVVLSVHGKWSSFRLIGILTTVDLM